MPRLRRRDRLPLNAEINLVNLIDVMLLLLVIFMITAPMMTGGLDINLPQADARPLDSKGGLIVTVTRGQEIVVDEVKMNYREFRTAFRALAANRGERGVYLRADRAVDYGLVVQVLSTMRSAGVHEIGLVTEPEDIP